MQRKWHTGQISELLISLSSTSLMNTEGSSKDLGLHHSGSKEGDETVYKHQREKA